MPAAQWAGAAAKPSLLRSEDGLVSGWLFEAPAPGDRPLLVCIHGGGCNAGYFAIGQRSILAQGQARNYPLLLVNRPGFAGNRRLSAADPVEASGPLIQAFVDGVQARRPGRGPVVVIGHSIGGAIAVEMAARRGNRPLLGIGISGIGDVSPPEIAGWRPTAGASAEEETRDTAHLSFGDPGTYDWRAIAAYRRIAEPWILDEPVAMLTEWPKRWPRLAAAVDVPVHLRLAEGEKIWETGERATSRMAETLTSSPHVDAAVLPEGGHLYELHKRGPELVSSQLDFADALTSTLARSQPAE